MKTNFKFDGQKKIAEGQAPGITRKEFPMLHEAAS